MNSLSPVGWAFWMSSKSGGEAVTRDEFTSRWYPNGGPDPFVAFQRDLSALLQAERRAAAEEMRERCVKRCKELESDYLYTHAANVLGMAADAIRSLPLPGDEKEGGNG